jgi:hypothetical protein
VSRSRNVIVMVVFAALLPPLALWVLFKPVRIFLPEFNGVHCFGPICVDEVSTLARAQGLHAAAMSNIAAKLTPLRSPPRTVFCARRACYEAFGGGAERGAAIFDAGVIIAPESWQTHIVEHELIHMLQAQELGLRGRERTPPWFKEGMPFSISAPPAFDLPDYAKPLVAEYEAWERRVGRDRVWIEAARL